MRFVLLALVMLGAALYLADPRSFGVRKGFELSGGKPVAGLSPRLDISKIGDFGAEMVDVVAVASNRAAEAYAASGNQVYRTAKYPPSYQAQLDGITLALTDAPEETAANMYDATKACLEEGGAVASPQLVNYFSGLVQIVAQIAALPEEEKAERFNLLSGPLTDALKAWLMFTPEGQRAENEVILADWAARPKALVACHLEWLDLP